jgi:hypothetical protein
MTKSELKGLRQEMREIKSAVQNADKATLKRLRAAVRVADRELAILKRQASA